MERARNAAILGQVGSTNRGVGRSVVGIPSGDMLRMGLQVAVAIGLPLLVGAFAGSAFDDRLGTRPWGLVVGLLAALAVGTILLVAILRRFLAEPMPAATDAARSAGRRWEREIAERELRRESGEDVEEER